MLIKRLYLQNFRNHASTLVEVDPGVNMIVGANGQGKTALLEALHLLVTGRSFRTHHLKELLSFGQSHFQVEALIVKNGVEQRLKVMYDGEQRRLFHNEKPLPSLKALIGIVQGVTLTPQDEELVSGAPQGRRQLIDLHLSQISPDYLHHLTRFHDAMKQRNLLLKQQAPPLLLEPYEQLMDDSSKRVSQARIEMIERLPVKSAVLLEKIELRLHPCPFVPNYSKERELGVTMTGIHKEDFSILLDGREARVFASEGQKRSAAMAIKFAIFEHLREVSGMRPVLCIDDVGMSFDTHRMKALCEELGSYGQVFLTACHPLTGIQGGQLCVDAGRVTAKSRLI